MSVTHAQVKETKKTEVGSYFISNYPPFSTWSHEHVPAALAAFNSPPKQDSRLGLYLHIPFCRKRCKFCYFRVYTDKNADEVETYLSALSLIFPNTFSILSFANQASTNPGAHCFARVSAW